MDFLFQLTDDEVRAAAGGNQQFLFESKGKYNGAAQAGDTLTLAVINRRLHKRDESKDVLEKVTLIKDSK